MLKRLNVAFLPQLLQPEELHGCSVIVTDVLRASTTIISALRNGIDGVIPCAEIDEALEWKRRLGPVALLGGERGGVIIPGFDRGNSPREFTPERVSGRRLVLCTTNGTVALDHCREAQRVLIGAFVNLSAVADAVRGSEQVTVLCAGTDRRITSEDVLFAGAVVERLSATHPQALLSDAARLADDHWRRAGERLASGTPLRELLGAGAGGRNLLQLGYDEDVAYCAEQDAVPCVPELDLKDWSIRLP